MEEHVLMWELLHLFFISLMDIISANFIVLTISVNICNAGVSMTTCQQMLVQCSSHEADLVLSFH